MIMNNNDDNKNDYDGDDDNDDDDSSMPFQGASFGSTELNNLSPKRIISGHVLLYLFNVSNCLVPRVNQIDLFYMFLRQFDDLQSLFIFGYLRIVSGYIWNYYINVSPCRVNVILCIVLIVS